ncbi:MAG: nucleoside hydrolase [Ilumatobacteraceae bacterium]
MVKLLIDTDCGIDDAVALWWAATQPDVELVGITTVFGNVDLAAAADNARRVLELAGRESTPIALGASEAFGPAPTLRRADFIHGADGVADTGRRPRRPVAGGGPNAVELLHGAVHAAPGEVTVVTIGPMANVAEAIAADASWAPAVRRLVVMGGTIECQGNALPMAEANIAHDPHAAATALAAPWATPPLLVGLDVTQRATITAELLALAHEGRSPAGADLAELLSFYARFGGTFCAAGEFPCHDALAVMAAARPGLVSGPVLPTAVQTGDGPALGMTVADRRQPFFEAAGQHQALPEGFHPCEVGTAVDVDAFRAELRALFGG